MIGYLKGTIIAKSNGVVIVEVNGIGYEVSLPGYVDYCLRGKVAGSEIELYTLYHHAEKHPTPKLYGFRNPVEREFFEELTRVKGVGPSRATTIFTSPVVKMAKAIAEGDVDALKTFKGVTPALAPKIIAELRGRAGKYALLPEDAEAMTAPTLDDVKNEVLSVLTSQLGHSKPEAQRMIEAALRRNSNIKKAEDLFEEVYRGEKR